MVGTVVFDLDGTLADTSGDLIAAANACFADRGLEPLLDPMADSLVAFHGGKAMLREGFARAPQDVLIPPTAVDDDYPRLLAHYAENIALHTRLYPGVEDALDAIAADRKRLAVCTNKPEGLAETLLTALGIRDRFHSLVGADTLPTRKPDPRPYVAAVERAGGTVARSFLLGDTETDFRTAANAGVKVALVAFGPEGRALERLSPHHLLEHFAELPDLSRRWLG